MKAPRLALLALLALGAVPAAQAQDGTAYYGLSLGELDYSDGSFSNPAFSDSVSTWHLMVGYLFTEHLGVEGAYGQSNGIQDTKTFPGFLPGQQDQVTYSTELDHILTIRLVGVLPFGKSGISLIGGVGYADIKQEIDITVNNLPFVSGDVSANNPTYFGAIQYDFERLAIRLGYEKYDFDGDVDGEETSLTFFYKL